MRLRRTQIPKITKIPLVMSGKCAVTHGNRCSDQSIIVLQAERILGHIGEFTAKDMRDYFLRARKSIRDLISDMPKNSPLAQQLEGPVRILRHHPAAQDCMSRRLDVVCEGAPSGRGAGLQGRTGGRSPVSWGADNGNVRRLKKKSHGSN